MRGAAQLEGHPCKVISSYVEYYSLCNSDPTKEGYNSLTFPRYLTLGMQHPSVE